MRRVSDLNYVARHSSQKSQARYLVTRQLAFQVIVEKRNEAGIQFTKRARLMKDAALAALLTFFLLSFPGSGLAEETRTHMTPERMGELILRVDPEAVLEGATWLFGIEELNAVVVFDPLADRMRIMIPIQPADDLDQEELVRLMQANFDSALDARYAIAQGMLWSTYIHPLSTLTDEQFLVAIGQTVNVATSFGTSYSSGLFIFGSGDSAEIERQRLIEELRRQTT